MLPFRITSLLRNAGHMLLGQGLSLLIQAGYFIIITRSLGAAQYGAFIAVVAFAQILAPFVGLGMSNLMIKNVARDRLSFHGYWGKLLLVTAISGLASIALVLAVARLVLPPSIPVLVVVCVGFAELFFARIVDGAAMAFQAVERLHMTARILVASALLRLLGIGALAWWAHGADALQWSIVYLLTTVLGAAFSVTCVQLQLGGPRLVAGNFRGELIEGLFFSVGLSAQTIYNDLDKTMLSRMASLDAVGIYAAAYRLIEVAFMPIRSLLSAIYPGFFRAGQAGVTGAFLYARRFLPKSIAYSLFSSVCLFLAAPLFPLMFGPDFVRSAESLRWLAVLPLLKTIHYLLADILTCTGHQQCRALIQALVAAFNVTINLWLIPVYSWRGAAWASILSDGLLAASIYVAIRKLDRRPVRDLAVRLSVV